MAAPRAFGEPVPAYPQSDALARITPAMKLMVNGQLTELADPQTVRDLVEGMGLGGRAVAVEVNKQVVPRRQHETTALRDGDVIEVVSLVGGG
jgi:sulfur carrier protein